MNKKLLLFVVAGIALLAENSLEAISCKNILMFRHFSRVKSQETAECLKKIRIEYGNTKDAIQKSENALRQISRIDIELWELSQNTSVDHSAIEVTRAFREDYLKVLKKQLTYLCSNQVAWKNHLENATSSDRDWALLCSDRAQNRLGIPGEANVIRGLTNLDKPDQEFLREVITKNN